MLLIMMTAIFGTIPVLKGPPLLLLLLLRLFLAGKNRKREDGGWMVDATELT